LQIIINFFLNLEIETSFVEYLKIQSFYVIFSKLFGFLNKSLDICQIKEENMKFNVCNIFKSMQDKSCGSFIA